VQYERKNPRLGRGLIEPEAAGLRGLDRAQEANHGCAPVAARFIERRQVQPAGERKRQLAADRGELRRVIAATQQLVMRLCELLVEREVEWSRFEGALEPADFSSRMVALLRLHRVNLRVATEERRGSIADRGLSSMLASRLYPARFDTVSIVGRYRE
jgi:hypothetical protein